MKLKGLKKEALLCTLMTFVVGWLLYLVFINLSFLNPFEKAFKDFQFTDIYYAERFNKQDVNQKIILVNVKHAGRFEIAQALQNISGQNPKVIGLDVVFKEEKMFFEDSLLKEALKLPNLVKAYYYDNDSIVSNHSFFKTPNENLGYINLNLESQNMVIRKFEGYKLNDNSSNYAFAVQIAKMSNAIDTKFIEEELSKPIPINYMGNKGAFVNYDIEEILESDNLPQFKDALVIMGYLGDGNTEFDIEDKHFTPMNEAWVGRAVPDAFGVVIHANILNMLTKNKLIYNVPKWAVYVIAFLCTYLLIFVSFTIYKRNSFVFDITEKVVQLLFSVVVLYLVLALMQSNVYLDVTPILLFALLGIEMIDYYEHLVVYLNKKFGWKSQLL